MREKNLPNQACDQNSKTTLFVQPVSAPNSAIGGDFLNTKKHPYSQYQEKCEKLEKRVADLESKFETLMFIEDIIKYHKI